MPPTTVDSVPVDGLVADDVPVPRAPRYDLFPYRIFIFVALVIVQKILVRCEGYSEKFRSSYKV